MFGIGEFGDGLGPVIDDTPKQQSGPSLGSGFSRPKGRRLPQIKPRKPTPYEALVKVQSIRPIQTISTQDRILKEKQDQQIWGTEEFFVKIINKNHGTYQVKFYTFTEANEFCLQYSRIHLTMPDPPSSKMYSGIPVYDSAEVTI